MIRTYVTDIVMSKVVGTQPTGRWREMVVTYVTDMGMYDMVVTYVMAHE